MASSKFEFDKKQNIVTRSTSRISNLKTPAAIPVEARASLLKTLTETPLKTPNTIGYHGTSLRSLSYFLKYGVFPTSLQEGSRLWYFALLPSTLRVPDLNLKCTVEKSDDDALLAAKQYAEIAAHTRLLMSLLKLNGVEAFRACFRFISIPTTLMVETFRAEPEFFESRGINEQTVVEYATKIENGSYRKVAGVVLGVHSSIYSSFSVKEPPSSGRYGEDGFCIHAPHGVSASIITSIDVVGSWEKGELQNYFQRLGL